MLYSIAIEQKNGNFIGRFPDLPSLIVEGNSMSDVIANARQTVMVYLSELLEQQNPIPQASEINEHLMKPEFAGSNWAIINISSIRLQDETTEVTLNISSSLLKKVHAKVQNTDMSAENFIIEAIKKQIG